MKINPDLERLAVAITELHGDPDNARFHDERSIQSIIRSLTEFGQQKPIVVLTNGKVIAGNGTFAAAKQLGWEKIAVVRFDDEKKARAYAIADNRTNEMSSWDGEALAKQLQELSAESFNLETISFSEADIERYLDGRTPVNPDEEWQGMPEFDQADKLAVRQLIVNFERVEDVAKFAELVKQSITDKTRSIWFPEVPSEHSILSKRYKAE